MSVYIITSKQEDLHCPIVVQVTTTLGKAFAYIEKETPVQTSDFSTQHISEGPMCYGQWHFPYQKCTMIFFAEGHDEYGGNAYAILRVETD